MIIPATHARPPHGYRPARSLADLRITHAEVPLHRLVRPGASFAPVPGRGHRADAGDGGFQQRLLEAQHADTVHGVPGSDRPVVGGIHLIDPRDQGIGAVLRKTQRLFGIVSKHCIQVEGWRQLTPRQLSERDLTPADLERMNEKYRCDFPMGLGF